MKNRPKKPSTPVERHETVRQEIISALEGRELSAKEISAEVRISEKEVYGHLEHIQKTVTNTGHSLVITPAGCRKCGFVFTRRDRFKKPGRCPACRGELISQPLFSILI